MPRGNPIDYVTLFPRYAYLYIHISRIPLHCTDAYNARCILHTLRVLRVYISQSVCIAGLLVTSTDMDGLKQDSPRSTMHVIMNLAPGFSLALLGTAPLPCPATIKFERDL